MSKNKSFRKYAATTMAVAVAASAVAPVVAGAEENKFSDVVKENTHYDNIIAMAEAGIVQGKDGEFKPYDSVQRIHVAKMLQRALKLEIPANAKEIAGKYNDVNVDKLAKEDIEAIAVATEAGIFEGDSNNNFGAQTPISRQQMASVLVRAYDLDEIDAEDVKINLDNINENHKANVQILANLGITDLEDDYRPLENVQRGQFATFLKRTIDATEDVTAEVKIESVSAINAKQAKVTFKGALPEGVDFTNFEIDGGLSVTDADISSDRKTVTLTVNTDFVRNKEYSVTATGIKDADGNEYADTTGTFTWAVQEGVTVNLEKTSVDQGEKFGLTVKDEDGKDVKNAEVEVTSFNTNLLKANKASGKPNEIEFEALNDIAGEVKVEVKTTLVDGTVLTNTFTVTVKEPVVNVAEKGFGFSKDPFNSGQPSVTGANYTFANTVAFQNYATPKTELTVGEDPHYLYAFTETNGDPDTEYIDWEDAKVTSSNAVAATAVIDGNNQLKVTPKNAGTTTLTVTLKDGTKKTFNVKVNAEPVFTDIYVNQTDVKLSDEARTEKTEGVDQQSVILYGLNQYKELENPDEGKMVISSSTDGIDLGPIDQVSKKGSNNTVELDDDQLRALAKDQAVFTITSQKDKIVKNAKVTINYFAKETDAKPSITKTVNVNVVDVDATEKAANLDVELTHSTIDANGLNTGLDNFDSKVKGIYLLDGKGNRLGTVASSGIEYLTEADETVKVEQDADRSDDKIVFTEDNEAQTYLRTADTVNVRVNAKDDTQDLYQDLAVNYENTAVIPNKADVNTKSAAIKLEKGVNTINMNQILFGLADKDQLIIDDTDYAIGVKKNAKNSGYLYNKALVTVTGTDGEVMPLGMNLYASDVTHVTTKDNSKWNNSFMNTKFFSGNKFVASGFDLDVDKSNINATDGVTVGGNEFTVPAGESLTMTVVVNGIYIEDKINVDTASKAEKEANNLLAKPVQVNVSIEGADN